MFPVVALLFIVMVLALVIVGQNIVLAIIASAYERASERIAVERSEHTMVSESYVYFCLRAGFLNCVWLWYNIRSGFSRQKVLSAFLASEWAHRSQQSRAFVLTLLPEMQVGRTCIFAPWEPSLEQACKSHFACSLGIPHQELRRNLQRVPCTISSMLRCLQEADKCKPISVGAHPVDRRPLSAVHGCNAGLLHIFL